jgi:hypothetical protein
MIQHWHFGISIVAGLLWVVVFTLFCKLFGLPRPASVQQREGALRRLSFNQYACLFGALSWGIAMFVSEVIDEYLQGMSGNPASSTSVLSRALRLVVWLVAGCFFGWTVWGGNRHIPPA